LSLNCTSGLEWEITRHTSISDMNFSVGCLYKTLLDRFWYALGEKSGDSSFCTWSYAMGTISLYHLSTSPIQILIVLPNSTTACAIFTSLSDMQIISLTKIMFFFGLCVSLASELNILRSNRFARCLLSEELFWKSFHLFQLQPTQQTPSHPPPGRHPRK
jgi:hypothetical protein